MFVKTQHVHLKTTSSTSAFYELKPLLQVQSLITFWYSSVPKLTASVEMIKISPFAADFLFSKPNFADCYCPSLRVLLPCPSSFVCLLVLHATPDSLGLDNWGTWHRCWCWDLIVEWRNHVIGEQHKSLLSTCAQLWDCCMSILHSYCHRHNTDNYVLLFIVVPCHPK